MVIMIANIVNGDRCDIVGSGSVVNYHGETFVITCRHVVEAATEGRVVAVLNSTENVFPAPTDIINLRPAYYHPDDEQGSSYDIAVFKVPISDQRFNAALDLEEAVPNEEVPIGTEASISGYPSSYLADRRVVDSNRVLPPKIVEGSYVKMPIEKLNIRDFQHKPKGIHSLRITSALRMGKGASGSPITRSSDGAFLGLYIAEVNATYTFLQENVPIHAACYVPACHVIDTIEAISGN